MLFCMAALPAQLHVAPGITATADSPSTLCAVYLTAAPLEWQPGARSMVPANFQPAGSSTVYAVI
jgi:hypothetical protein